MPEKQPPGSRSNSKLSSAKNYGVFAEIYDEVMSAVPYDLWYDYLNFLYRYHGFEDPESILELACGTGEVMKRFLGDSGENVKSDFIIGVDRSEYMLAQAREKLASMGENFLLVQQDIRELKLACEFDFIYSIFDSINYITGKDELERVFKGVYDHLKEDGVFIFDYNTRSRLQRIEEGVSNFYGHEFSCQWQDIVIKEEDIWKVELTINIDDREEIIYEQHEEKAFPLEEVKSLLHKSGFDWIGLYETPGLKKGREDSSRVHFMASSHKPPGLSPPGYLYAYLRWKMYKLKHLLF